MSEMVERVARAMILTAHASGSTGDDLIRDMARQAIKEMRDPSEGMLDATKALSSSRAYVADVGRAMIDAANPMTDEPTRQDLDAAGDRAIAIIAAERIRRSAPEFGVPAWLEHSQFTDLIRAEIIAARENARNEANP